MPDGWFRLRKLQLNCYNGVFDILGDGIKRQRISADRKGQAQRIAKRLVQLANNDCCERSMICCRRRQMGSTIPFIVFGFRTVPTAYCSYPWISHSGCSKVTGLRLSSSSTPNMRIAW